jgi:Zn-dependent peptidase ImmA (M78 family)
MATGKANAEKEARAILRDAEVIAPPVPVARIATDLGIELSYRPLQGDISGILRREAGRVVVGVNSLDSPSRQRFTIAHELGHFRLHEGYEVIVDKLVRVNLRVTPGGPLATPEEERDANYFAAELLMPERLLKARAKVLVGQQTIMSGDWLVEELAGEFDVSRQAMLYRLVNLGLLDDLAIAGG